VNRPTREHRTAVRRALALCGALAVLAACGDDSTDVGNAAGARAAAVPATTTSTTTTSTTTSTTTTTTVAAPPETAPPPTAAPAPPPPAPPREEVQSAPGGTRCLVRLHGKGGDGSGTSSRGGITVIQPAGNASGWGGRQWVYFPDATYRAARNGVAAAIDAEDCGQVIVYGFSNGAGFATKLYCRGETFGSRLVAVVVDDPVTDHGADACAPARGVRVTLYWTGALAGQAPAGWRCEDADWTCDGGTSVGIDAYQSNLGVTRKRSPNSGHQPYDDPPEINAWN
jgi:hypothetical protein